MVEKCLRVVAVKEEKYYPHRPLKFQWSFFSAMSGYEKKMECFRDMKKKYRIKKNEEFQEVFQRGTSMANRQFVIYMLDRPGQPYFRIGLSVSKKLGKAVVRNRIKRYIRQVFLEMKDDILPGKDYVIIARIPAADMTYFEVKSSLLHVLRKAGALKREIK
ncbi:ribonuclease P protein component [Parageobacillus thermantarcticus]|uniref:Ribonuclease P protein component n=2 Tax=Parageobacillus thermantarcticus TaxID=186116 RepID=A0A1I0ST75_9BACL|nr:ribonuclease P protein component [Parageobacillus thermantarcticus]